MLRAESITFKYGTRKVLSDVCLNVSNGELLAILGANGAGKSTLIKILSGSLKTDSGTIFYEDKNINLLSPKEKAKLRAVLEQQSSCAFEISVGDLVMLGAYATGGFFKSPKIPQKIAEECLADTGLEGFINRNYFELSGGEMRRVQLARALYQAKTTGAKILFLDEPLANLDPSHSLLAMKAARKFADNGGTVVAVLHEPNTALHYADKTALMLNGKLEYFGSSNEVITAKNLEKIYGAKCEIITNTQGLKAVVFQQ